MGVESWADDFYESAGPLVHVRGDLTPAGDQYWVLEFVFENGMLRLSCNDDTDEIVVQPHDPNAPALDASALVDVSNEPVFAPLLGKHIEYLWWMTNHRGYHDAFQMRLLDHANRSDTTRQFEVAASAMYVRAVGS